ncbi:hypothetical protein PMKS-003558 [Pichia membranifaciens]|uniref:Uncharacterized protein n=1 Tax=Pichia membranifaciens TaxID=4926 RepID=A0A1Q2YKI3_9ASCO|nr:hypothetical protein PMKS-003558 [Pichia membranifaciens]
MFARAVGGKPAHAAAVGSEEAPVGSKEGLVDGPPAELGHPEHRGGDHVLPGVYLRVAMVEEGDVEADCADPVDLQPELVPRCTEVGVGEDGEDGQEHEGRNTVSEEVFVGLEPGQSSPATLPDGLHVEGDGMDPSEEAADGGDPPMVDVELLVGDVCELGDEVGLAREDEQKGDQGNCFLAAM